jgi:hypothetical protein
MRNWKCVALNRETWGKGRPWPLEGCCASGGGGGGDDDDDYDDDDLYCSSL